VAQLGRAPGSGPGGRGFKSHQPDELPPSQNVLLLRIAQREDQTTLRGFLQNLADRIRSHNAGESKATKHGVPWILIHTESFGARSEAAKRERYYKSGRGREELDNL
jgi:putative endonuclease